jgi:hypothetical protein
MLSSVLRSERRVAVNIEIMRAFVRLRSMLAGNAELADFAVSKAPCRLSRRSSLARCA